MEDLSHQEESEPPTTTENRKKIDWKRELLFWTTILANLITISFFLYKLFKNGI